MVSRLFAHVRLPLGVAVLLMVSVSAGAALSDDNLTLVSAEGSRVVFEVDLSGYRLEPSRLLEGTERLVVPGFGSFSEPGEPTIPGRDYLVAVPEGASAAVRVTVLESAPLGARRLEPVPFPVVFHDEHGSPTASPEVRIDPEVYEAASTSVTVRAGRPQRLRNQRVVPIRVIPLTYEPTTGEAVLASRLRVEVSFSGASGAAGRPGPVLPEIGEWERVYQRVLVNPEQGAGWRLRHDRPRTGSARAARVFEATAGPLIKLKVFNDGLHRVRASTAVGKGFQSGTPTDSLHLFKRSYDSDTMTPTITDVPYLVFEGSSGQPGVFDGDDVLLFYGQRLMNDALQDAPNEKFSDYNVYWFGVGQQGRLIGNKSVGAGSVRPDTATATFTASRYYQRDFVFQEHSPVGVRDFFYFNVPLANGYDAPFEVGSLAPNGSFTITAEFLGGDVKRSVREVMLRVANSVANTLLTSAFVPRTDVVVHTTAPVSNSVLVNGVNTLRVRPSPDRGAVEALLNWFRIDYASLYRAVGNVLEFTNGAQTGSVDLNVIGLSRNDVMLFDVSDPTDVRRCDLGPGNFVSAGSGYVLRFNDNVATEGHYVATPLDKVAEIKATDMVLDQPSAIIGDTAENGVDVLVVAYHDFIPEMQRWVDYRRAQGYRVLMVDVEDVMDEFRGGVVDPRGIKDFIRRFFTMGNASYVVLVGDSSEDNKRVDSNSGPAFVPTESYAEHVFGGGFDEDEVVTSDKWYVMLDYDFIRNLPPNQPDYFPDLFIGRLPVGNVTELKNVIDKTLAFESPKETDFWRRRVIRIADDAWSFGSDFQSCYRASETGFEQAERNAIDLIEQAQPGAFDIVRFFLSQKIEHPPLNQCVTGSVQTDRTRINATPALFTELNAGASMVSVNAHMNRYQWCHEFLFTASILAPDGNRDHPRLQNNGRPWVIFGMGCHFSDYAINAEMARQNQNDVNGDSFAELLLFLQNRGAVNTYGSSGFEYLSTESRHTGIIAEVAFSTPPTTEMPGSMKSQARWIFGELMGLSEIVNINRYGQSGPGLGAWGQAVRMHVLGDPLLRVDGGPPRFEVTVDGEAIESGGNVSTTAENDSIAVVATISDEVAIDELGLQIAGQDATDQMTVTRLNDNNLTAARAYEVTFGHKLRPQNYDIVLRASQAEDTGSGYHINASFVLAVRVDVKLTADGRQIVSGDPVPGGASYVFNATTPVPLERALIGVEVDGESFTDFEVNTQGYSTAISFTPDLAEGAHELAAVIDGERYPFDVIFSSQPGLRDVVTYPNPFRDDTHFIYTNEVAIKNGTIDVYTTSGKKVIRLEIPPSARPPGQNAVYWDGRTWSGDEIANGVYLYVVRINQDGHESVHRGRLVRAK